MIIDAPQYDTEDTDEKKGKETKEIDFKEQTSEDLLNLFNQHLK